MPWDFDNVPSSSAKHHQKGPSNGATHGDVRVEFPTDADVLAGTNILHSVTGSPGAGDLDSIARAVDTGNLYRLKGVGPISWERADGFGPAAAGVVFPVFTWAPGLASDPARGRFQTFPEVIAAIDTLRPGVGIFQIAVDTTGAPAIIPPGTYEMSGVRFHSFYNVANFTPKAIVTVQEGVTFTGEFPTIADFVVLDFEGSTPIFEVPMVGTSGAVLNLVRGGSVAVSGAGPMIHVQAGRILQISLENVHDPFGIVNGGILSNSGPIVDLDAGAFCVMNIGPGVQAPVSWAPDTIAGAVGSFLGIHTKSPSAVPQLNHSGFLGGTFGFRRQEALEIDGPYGDTSTPAQAAFGKSIEIVNPGPGGTMGVTIIDDAAAYPGGTIEVVLAYGAFPNVAAVPTQISTIGANTIDGAATFTLTRERESVILRSNGLAAGAGDWRVVGGRGQ